MIDRASSVPVSGSRSRWIAMASLAFVVVVALIVGRAGAPYLFQGATLERELATQVQATTGLVLTSQNHGRFDLLPRPHIVIKGLHFADPSGTLSIDAEGLEGDVRLLPLLVGRVELGAATLIRPKLAIDLDGRAMKPDSMIGRALHSNEGQSAQAGRRLGTVTLLEGMATLKSRALGWTPIFEGVDVTIDWPDLDSPATLTGSFMIQKTAADIAVWLAQPSSLMRGDSSPLALRIQSTPLDLSANGDLTGAGASNFHGHLALRAPSLPALFTFASTTMPAPAPFANAVLNSDVSIGFDHDGRSSLNLPSLRLRLDGNDYEGALALQGGARPALSGTLATEQLMLAPFLERAPKLLDAEHHWTHDPFVLKDGNAIDLDLRISATHLRAAPFTLDDAALAVMTHNDRTEIALVQGKAYGGGVKGRVSVGFANGSLTLRGTGSLTDADAATLTWDGFGRQIAAGAISGSVDLESSGDSPAALMQHLTGWAKGNANAGEVSGIDVGRGLRTANTEHLAALLPALRGGRTPFSSLAFGLRIVDGTATIEEGTIKGKDAIVTLTGGADVATRGLNLHAKAAAPAAKGTPDTKDIPIPHPISLEIEGSFDKVVLTSGKSGAANHASP